MTDDGKPSTHIVQEQAESSQKVATPKVRRSARLQATTKAQDRTFKDDRKAGPATTASASVGNSTSLKRKRGKGNAYLSPDTPSPKQTRTSTRHAIQESSGENHPIIPIVDPVQNWVLNEQWPPQYFEPDDQTKQELLEHDSWAEAMMACPPPPVVKYVEINGFRYPLPVPKLPSIRRKQSDASLSGPSGQNRDSKSVQYRDPRYISLLEAKGSFLHDFGRPPPSVTDPGQHLLDAEQVVPQNTMFRDETFERLCQQMEHRNESRVVQDVARLLVPSAENLAICGAAHLDILIENVNEAWTESIPVEGPRPQPDYSVGFRKSAFTNEQLRKLAPLVGSVFDTSYYVATYRMYFPFLTCEVKCGASALEIADRQNAHSMTIAVRSVIELYRAVGRDKELDRQVLAFSISHDHQSVRIYAHYAVVEATGTTFYRHLVHLFSFTVLGGKDRWTAYKFTKTVYDRWMPLHLKRICSAIDQLPSGLDFQVHDGTEAPSEAATGLSQGLESLHQPPNTSGLLPQQDETQPIAQIATPDTSVSKDRSQGAAKRAKMAHTTQENSGKRKV
ncbi:uncharacterized protein AB675_1228 [Cyphellophora attinorum]|uniref:DUF7924 domain-containing protein n=1 Tax=Cyphellophora attinorum TaxID=1664694 RepID=A0A0N1H2W0_9EURO|nr:uncharacterized protein AB675_1228 [Phialophora attinorum]KPI35710.1 hypothetical protein AB675_1228 [Phialophora attinorum]